MDTILYLLGFGVLLFIFLIILTVAIFMVVTMWKLFEKAGQPGWACIIPIYNLVILLRIIGRPWWWVFLFFIPYLNMVISIITTYELAKTFKKGAWFTVGLVFLPIIFYPILAFGRAVYTKPN